MPITVFDEVRRKRRERGPGDAMRVLLETTMRSSQYFISSICLLSLKARENINDVLLPFGNRHSFFKIYLWQ